ncbi:hypothetical protein [Pectobacterium odoriferum]|uniref:hypothetical protein n=1 Tax=Pectobacterium odoriferum TaxID=78398 RepID=UPI000AE75C56|nr:hypothetical protein [Pectobacterium odoriferum]
MKYIHIYIAIFQRVIVTEKGLMALALFINILLLGMAVISCFGKNLPDLLVG